MSDWLGGWLGGGAGASATVLPVRGGQVTTWFKNQSDANLRESAIIISAIADGSPAPLATDFSGEVYIRLGGTTFTLASGTLTNVGYDGTWMYQATQAETDIDANEIELRIVDSTYYGQTLINLDPGGEMIVGAEPKLAPPPPEPIVVPKIVAPPPRRPHIPVARPMMRAKSRAAAMIKANSTPLKSRHA